MTMRNRVRWKVATMATALVLAAVSLGSCTQAEKRDENPNRPVEAGDFQKVEELPAIPSPGAATPDRATGQLWEQAQREAAAGRKTDLLITLHQIRLRDPWHFEANTLYQDVRLETVGAAKVYGEYRELFARDMEDGSALYFMLRPMLLKASGPATATGDRARAERAQKQYLECVAAAQRGMPIEEAKPLFMKLFEDLPLHVAGHRLWQDMVMNEPARVASGTPEAAQAEMEREMKARVDRLCGEYATLLERHEADGDARYLYERVASLRDPVESSLRYARDFLGGVSSLWMFYGFGRCAVDRVAAIGSGAEQDPEAAREGHALLCLAELCYDACIRGDALSAGEALYGRGLVRRGLGRLQDAVADFRAANTVLGGSDPELLALWIETLGELGEYKTASEIAETATRLYPSDGHFVVERVRMLMAGGDAERARAMAAKWAANGGIEQEYREILRKLAGDGGEK